MFDLKIAGATGDNEFITRISNAPEKDLQFAAFLINNKIEFTWSPE